MGGALGQASFTEWCDPGSPLTQCEDSTTAWKLFLGYRFNAYVGAEASFIQWGKVTASTASASASAEQRSYGLAGVGSFEIGGGFAAFGKLGILLNEQTTRRVSPNPSTVNRDDTAVHYGVGARYAFPRYVAVRAEWEKTEKLEAQLLSIGAEYRF